MICPFCGENNRDQATFCSRCGSPMRESHPPVYMQQSTDQWQTSFSPFSFSHDTAPRAERPSLFKNGRDPAPKRPGKWLVGWIAIAIACVIVAASGIKLLPLILHKESSTPAAPALPTQHTPNIDPHVVYVFNQGTSSSSGTAILRSYDSENGKKTDIVLMPNTNMHDAQVSTDGKSVIFVADSAQQSKLQMININGQGLHTLLSITSPTQGITDVQWSPDQSMVVFDEEQGDNKAVYLLHLTNGALQTEMGLTPDHLNFWPRAWIGNGIVAMQAGGAFGNGPLNTIYLLDISKGSNQTENNLLQVTTGQNNATTTDFVSSSDGTKLFFSTAGIGFGEGVGIQNGPSSINVRSISAGSTSSVYRSPVLAIVAIQAIDPHSVLMLVQNYDSRGSGNTSNNGIWRINTDGTGLTRLSSISTSADALFDGTLYDTQLHVSSQGTYALVLGSNQTQTLLYGSTAGGNLKVFASTSVGSLRIAGWTTE